MLSSASSVSSPCGSHSDHCGSVVLSPSLGCESLPLALALALILFPPRQHPGPGGQSTDEFRPESCSHLTEVCSSNMGCDGGGEAQFGGIGVGGQK